MLLSRHSNKSFVDLSPELSDELDWKAGTLKTLVHHLDIAALAYEPVSGILAVGTSKGVIDLYGDHSRGVEHRLELEEPIRIRNLYFASSLFKLICVDGHDRLIIWDLRVPGKPKLQSIVGFRQPISCIAVSASHSHVFLALSSGEIQTYDLLCSRISPYSCPNMWALYEENVVSHSIPSPAGAGSPFPVEVVIHPRDLNKLFVAYGGGVVLIDLTQRNTISAYEYILPPGAPGGAGFHDQNLLKHRRPEVTAFAIHPTGHVFAVGYIDGTIVFWAVEDEDKPLFSLTVDGQHDVHAVDASRLDVALARPRDPSDGPREPIFRLAWSGFPNSSDPRGGDTVLTVLGGLRNDETPGVTAFLLPPFNPPEPPAPVNGATVLNDATRFAMRETVIPIKSYPYACEGVPQDFLLLPKESPYFSGTWDPAAILLLSDGDKEARILEAYQFPPPSFVSVPEDSNEPPPQTPIAGSDPTVARDIEDTLQMMKLTDDPRTLRLPPSLWSGSEGIISGQLVNLERDSYEVLKMRGDISVDDSIRLAGGSAWVEDHEGELKLMKFQPHRILVTYHADLTVRFRDLNAFSLVSSDTSPLQSSFPSPLPELTIDLVSLLADPAVSTRTSPKFLDEARIVASSLAPQSLECAVALQNGAVAVYRLGSTTHMDDFFVHKSLLDKELVSVEHVPAGLGRRYLPSFMMLTERGSVSALSICDIGFLAVAYAEGSLLVVDMRGPKVILRSSAEDAHRRSFLHRHDADPVQALTWTVAGTDGDPQRRVLLVAVRASGFTSIFTLSRNADGSWVVNPSPESTETVAQPLPDASFVLDSRTGRKCRANRGGLGAALSASGEDVEKGKTFWICAGVKGARCMVDITGERIARVDWPSRLGKVDRVSIVQKNAATVLVAFTDKREALVYSIPFLEHMHSLQINQSSPEPLSVDETGDYVEWIRHPCGLVHTEKYGTLFNVRRSGPYKPPQVDLTYGRSTVPPQPQPVAIGPPSLLTSVWGYIATQGMTGDQVDILLGGPDRPIPVSKAPAQQPKPSASKSPTPKRSASPGSTHSQNAANNASSGVSSLYERLNAALTERGEMLGSLEDSFRSLESGSKNMLSTAKSLAAQQTAKRWFQL